MGSEVEIIQEAESGVLTGHYYSSAGATGGKPWPLRGMAGNVLSAFGFSVAWMVSNFITFFFSLFSGFSSGKTSVHGLRYGLRTRYL
jgi:hypothetical protein